MGIRAGTFSFELFAHGLIHKLALALLVAVLMLSLVSLFGRHTYLELATHFRLQYALASVACLLLFTVFRSWRLLPFAAAALIFNLLFILPYYFAARGRHDQPAALRLRLLHANVLMTNKNYAALINVVREEQPDVIVLQEFTEKWMEETRGFVSEYPYYKSEPRPGGSGMAIFSRYPLEDVAVLTLDDSSHLAILAKARVNGATVSILALHPPTPVTAAKFLNRNRQFKEAASILRAASGPKLLIGDLNTTMWSPYFADLERESGLRDARVSFGLGPSWPMPLPAFLQLPIDHCLVSDEVVVKEIRTGGRTGSDHRPLIVDVQLDGPTL